MVAIQTYVIREDGQDVSDGLSIQALLSVLSNLVRPSA